MGYFADKYGYASEEQEDTDVVQDPDTFINNEQSQEMNEEPGYFARKYGYEDEPTPPAPEELEDEDPTWQDYGRMVMSGGAAIGEGVGWLLERFEPTRAAGKAIKQRSKESQEAWLEGSLDAVGLEEKGLSDQARKALQTEFLGKGSFGDKWDKAKLTAASSILGTMAGLGVGGIFTKGLTAVGTRTGAVTLAAPGQALTTSQKVAAALGYGAGEAAVAAPTAGAFTRDEILEMKHEDLMSSLEYQAAYEGLSGLEEKQRRQQARELVADAAAGKSAALTMLSTFVLSSPFSSTLARATQKVPYPKGRVAGGVAGAAEEATQEFLQSGAEKISENIAVRQYADPTRGLTEGALEEGVGGAMAGGIMGGVVGTARGPDTEADIGPMADLERQQNAARQDAANKGGDALTQEVAAARAGIEAGAAIDEETIRRRRLQELQQQIDEEAAYADEQVKEDEARAAIQAEAAERYERQIKQIEAETEGRKKARDLGERVKKSAAKVKKEKFQEAKARRKAEKQAITKAEKARKADIQLAGLRARRQALGLEPEGEGKPPPGAAGVGVLKPEVAAALEKGKVPETAMARELQRAAHKAAPSPKNKLPEPTPAQIDAGNYQKGHVKVEGLDISIENPAGSVRKGTDATGKPWSQKMRDHYGYIRGTESAEGTTEQIDVFLGEAPQSPQVFVVDQIDQRTGGFDEHKVMMGYPNQLAAVRAYRRNYTKGWKVGPVTTMSVPEFKEWLKSGDQTVPVQPDKIAGTTPALAEQLEEEVIRKKTRKGGRRTRILYRQGEEGSPERLADEIKQAGGFTVNPRTGQPATEGYAVGVGLEEVIEGEATPEQVAADKEKHAKVLEKKGHFLGAWVDKGKTYLDVSAVFQETAKGRSQALALARKNKQLGIQRLSVPVEKGYLATEQFQEDGDAYFEQRALEDARKQNFKSRERLVHMSPQEFLDMAETLRFEDEQKAREVKMVLDKFGDQWNSLPMLSFLNNGETARVVGHEGRHRAMELQRRGVESMPVRLISAEGGEDIAIRWTEHMEDGNPLPKTLIGQDGVNTISFPVKYDEGRDFKDFFSSVTKGITGVSSTGAAYEPVIPAAANALDRPNSPLARFSEEYAKHRGNFDDHIAFSIPGYKEVQQMVGTALASLYKKGSSLLDIGASEGSFAKAVTALSGMHSVSLDPNPDMQQTFYDTSQVEGAEYSMKALGSAEEAGQLAWREGEIEIEYYDPGDQKFDVIQEAMVFQFVSNDREAQITRVKELLKSDGVLIVEEKLHTDNQAANERKKNSYKGKFFDKKDLDAKSAEVLEGMHKNMVDQYELENILSDQFDHVVQFWDSGNFKGYMASDSRENVDRIVKRLGNTNSEYATTTTPRTVSGAVGVTREVTHYSPAKGLTVLEGSRYGTGISGAEKRRLSYPEAAGIRDRVYLYAGPHRKEAGLGANKYSWVQGNLYDLDNDPLDLRRQVREDVQGREDQANELDSRIKNAGFAGAFSEKSNNTGYVFGDVDLTRPMYRLSEDETPAALKKFLRGSVVKDVVYHATAADFEAFQVRSGDVGIHVGTFGQANDRAAYLLDLAEDIPELSDKYASQQVMPVYISLKRPLRMQDMGAWNDPEDWADALDGLVDINPNRDDLPEIVAAIKEAGYDGIVYKNEGEITGRADIAKQEKEARNAAYAAIRKYRGLAEDIPIAGMTAEEYMLPEWETYLEVSRRLEEYKMEEAEDSYILFDPTQIKSAVGNIGTYDPTDARIRYSLSKPRPGGLTRAQAERALAGMMAKMPLMQPNILRNHLEAPQEIREQIERDNATSAKGVYDPRSDKLYIFAENNKSIDDLISTALHEGVTHKGLRYLLGERTTDILQDVYDNADRAGIRAIAKRYGLDLDDAGDRLVAAEEYIASIAESGIESGVLTKVLSAVRQVLRDLGIISSWSDSDIRALLRNARKSLGGKELSQTMILSEAEVAETGEIVEIEEPADQVIRQISKRRGVAQKLLECVQ